MVFGYRLEKASRLSKEYLPVYGKQVVTVYRPWVPTDIHTQPSRGNTYVISDWLINLIASCPYAIQSTLIYP